MESACNGAMAGLHAIAVRKSVAPKQEKGTLPRPEKPQKNLLQSDVEALARLRERMTEYRLDARVRRGI